MYNVSQFEPKLKEHSYRSTTWSIVTGWSREKLSLFLSNLHPDQHDYPVPDYQDMSTDDIRRLVCLIVWGWGWEGTDYFHKMHR